MLRKLQLAARVVRFALPRAARLAWLRVQIRAYELTEGATAHPDACQAYAFGHANERRQAVCRNCGRTAAEHVRQEDTPACRRCGHMVTSHSIHDPGACHLCACRGFQ